MSNRAFRFIPLLVVGLSLISAAPASAAVTFTHSGSTLAVESDDASDAVRIFCDWDPEAPGTITFFVNGSQQDIPVSCSSLTRLEFHGNGGNDSLEPTNTGSLRLTSSHLTGGPGNDVLPALGPGSLVDGGAGNDKVFAMGGNSVAYGGDGNDLVSITAATGYGGAGKDRLEGSSSIDRLFGGLGNDSIQGQGGDDLLSGQGGNDFIRGESGPDHSGGRDIIYGGDGKDNLGGNGGPDQIFGNKGNDKLTGGPGKDKLNGGAGSDLCIQEKSGGYRC